MSLWSKSLDSITYTDIEAFCLQQNAESIRLDYKLEIPTDLGKVVAAFGNTLGGLIVLGVEASKTTNTPNWPPTRGMKSVPGIEERITSICRDTIYPPIRPQISPIIDNPHVPGTAFAVLRVDESVEAPHAVNGRIYERTGSQGTPYDLSDIDRIAHLLGRRSRIEEQRIELVSMELKRASRQLTAMRVVLAANAGLFPTASDTSFPRGLPLRWASVIPVYPWQDLCQPQRCYELHTLFQRDGSLSTWQKVPGGVFGKKRIPADMGGNSAEAMCCSLSTKGHVFAIQCATDIFFTGEVIAQGRAKPKTMSLKLEYTRTFATQVFDVAARFYTSDKVERPGYVILSIGLIDIFGWRMLSQSNPMDARTGRECVDDDYTDDLRLTLEDFLTTPGNGAYPLFKSLEFGFDL